MAILYTKGPWTLSGQDQEVIFGPGYNDLNLSDANSLYVQVHTEIVGSWTILFQQSLDGVNWVNFSVGPATGAFGATFTATASTYSNLFSTGIGGRPYMKIKMINYSSGELTITKAISTNLSVSR